MTLASFSSRIGFWVCVSITAAYAFDDLKTIDQLRKEAANDQSVQTQSGGEENSLKLGAIQPVGTTPVVSAQASCPDPIALDLFKHQIAYQRTEELDPLRGLRVIHASVWERGNFTGFYIHERLNEFVPTVRKLYISLNHEMLGGPTCPVQQSWKKCVEQSAGIEGANNVLRTCTITINLRTIPAWKPSPNDQFKRSIAQKVREEIETQWRGVQEIVVRDFNLKDNQITMYLKMPDGDYYQGCGFYTAREPHCDGWHSFGQAPLSSIRKWIFARPYRLK